MVRIIANFKQLLQTSINYYKLQSIIANFNRIIANFNQLLQTSINYCKLQSIFTNFNQLLQTSIVCVGEGRVWLGVEPSYANVGHSRGPLGLLCESAGLNDSGRGGGHLYFRVDIILVNGISKHTLSTYFPGGKQTLNTRLLMY